MPIWNPNPEYLRKSIDSILGQTHDNIEVLLVFDKSNPETDNAALALLEQYHDEHRLRVYMRHRRCGLSNAINFGIESSKGDYIARMDGDDISLPTRLEESFCHMGAKNAHLVGTWAYVIDEKDRIIGRHTLPYDSKEIRRLIILHNCFLHSSVLFRRNLISKIGFYNPSFHGAEDYELYMRAIGRGYRLLNVPEYLIYLRESTSSITRGNEWTRSRRSYIRAKFRGLSKYKVSDWPSLFYCIASISTLIIAPCFSLWIKNLIGWYEPFSLEPNKRARITCQNNEER